MTRLKFKYMAGLFRRRTDILLEARGGNCNMKIKRTRMLPLYPWRCFEAECEREDGSKVYVNVGLPLEDGKKLDYLYEDNWWSYRKPLTEIDFNDEQKVYEDYVWDKECEEIAHRLVNAWNADPVYRETENAWEKGAWDE